MKSYPKKTILCSCKIRIYPSAHIRQYIDKMIFDYCFVYNFTLKILSEEENKITLGQCFWRLRKNQKRDDMVSLLRNYSVSGAVYQAYRYFYSPKHKNKYLSIHRSRISLFVQYNEKSLVFNSNRRYVFIPTFGYVKCRGVPDKAKGIVQSMQIQRTNIGEYYLIAQTKSEIEPLPLLNSKSPVGIDMSLKYFGVLNDGQTLADINPTEKELKNLAVKHRYLKSKVPHSKNYEKARIKYQKAFNRICNRKLDKIHKITHRLIKEHSFIATEQLDLMDMSQNHRFSRAIHNISFGQFFSQLAYKADWNNRTFIQVDRYFPSTKTCSFCGYVNSEINDVSIHDWTCPRCGEHHNRDINAAQNILREAERIYRKEKFKT